jgi:hypothetical protein
MCGTIQRILKNKTRHSTQIKFYETVAILTGLHGNGTQVMPRRDRSRLQPVQLHFLRSVAGLRWKDHIRNEIVQNSLEIQSLLDNMDEYCINWLSCVQRMEA